MQKRRLFGIIYYLLDKGSSTAPELAEKFEVSVRTIYRDIDVLSGIGIPVYSVQGKGGGIYILTDYVINKALLTKNEQNQILDALQTVSAVTQNDKDNLLIKLGALFKQTKRDWIEVDFSSWGCSKHDKEKFSILKNCIIDKKIITFFYTSSYGVNTKRKVKPLKLVYKAYAWYLQAYCTEKNDFRTFKISRIHSLSPSEETFSDNLTPPPIDVEYSKEAYSEQIELKFKPEISYRVYDEFDINAIQTLDNGDLKVAFTIYGDISWLYSYLLAFGKNVEVIKPSYVKERLAEEAKEIYMLYKK